jgi:hypothetical protein
MACFRADCDANKTRAATKAIFSKARGGHNSSPKGQQKRQGQSIKQCHQTVQQYNKQCSNDGNSGFGSLGEGYFSKA